jgi:NAD(P)-dependent dehydrogenase (short-subunit alcohol dehydrogenase family)
MKRDLEGKVALLTGASSGMGFATARRMLTSDSSTARSRSIQPWAAAASIMAYSPLTW